jgi:hypothetical protein
MWMPDPSLVHGAGDGAPAGGPPPEDGPGGPPPEGGPGGPPPGGPKPQVDLKDHGIPGEHAFEGDITLNLIPQPDGTLLGDADGDPIHWGFYQGDFFKVEFAVGPGCWEIWAHVEPNGDVEGMISVGGGKGFPNLAYGKRLD